MIRGKSEDFAAFLKAATEPITDDFVAHFHQRIREIDELSRDAPEGRDHWMKFLFEEVSEELDQSLVHRHGRHKPFGYAGDYLSIDLTYQELCESPGRGRFWDTFYHRQDAPRAVRDRKDRFGRELRALASRTAARPLRVLNIASGPGREIVDGISTASLGPGDVRFLCVEIDPAAVAYARDLLGPTWEESVRFHEGNALRFRTEERFDLVWSAGLFDYLSDRMAKRLLKNMWNAVSPGGRLIVGNFADSHRSRAYIEWCGAWFLIHRGEDELFRLATEAEMPISSCRQELDEWGAIRFLVADKID